MSRTSAEASAGAQPAWDLVEGARIGRVRLVLLGWRMSVATADGRRRLALAGVGAALAMLVLLLGLGAISAKDAQLTRTASRTLVAAENPADGLAVASEQRSDNGWPSWFRGIEVNTVVAAPIGTAPPPPGLDAFPAPGTIAASPEFARLQAADPLFASRYPGTISEIIRPEGLAGPKEVFAWISVAKAPDGFTASGYGPSEESGQGSNTEGTDLVLPLGVLLFVLPVLILVGTSTRLGSSQRDQRMAAMRLVGATPGEVRLVSAAEAGAIGAVGVVGGLLLFVVLRPLASYLPWRPGVFVSDLAPSPALVALIAVGLPLLGIGAGYLSQRRVVTSPLGVTRRAAPRSPRAWRLVPLLIGVVLLVILMLNPYLVDRPDDAWLVYILLLGGAGLTMLGLVLATPLVGVAASAGLLRLPGLPVAAQLGARRVQAEPTAAARVVTGTAVLAFVATWILASLLPVFDHAQTGYLDEQQSFIAPGTVAGAGRLSDLDGLRAAPGVAAVVPVFAAHSRRGGESAVVDCPRLSAVFATLLPGCAADRAFSIWSEPGTFDVRLTDPLSNRRRDLGTVRFETPDTDTVADPTGSVRSALSSLLGAVYVIPASRVTLSDLPADWGTRYVVGTDGSSEAIETVKTVLFHSSGQVPVTTDEERLLSVSDRANYQRLALAYLLALAFVAAVSLAVGAADDLRTRRRSLASLAAAGTPISTLRRAGLVQLLLTLLPAMLLSLAAASIAAWTYSSLAVSSQPGASRPFDPSVILAVGVGSILIVVAAYVLSLTTLRSAVDVRGLRTG